MVCMVRPNGHECRPLSLLISSRPYARLCHKIPQIYIFSCIHHALSAADTGGVNRGDYSLTPLPEREKIILQRTEDTLLP